MDFEGQYLTYREYQELGGSLGQTPFNLLEFEARRRIDLRTLNRLVNYDNIPEEVKLCEFNLISTINSYADTKNKISSNNAKSETIDGYSISYVTPTEIKDIIETNIVEINDIIDTYLFGLIINGEHILYNGM